MEHMRYMRHMCHFGTYAFWRDRRITTPQCFRTFNSDHENSWLSATFRKAIIGIVRKKQLGASVPMEHTKEGFTASVKYNANKVTE